MKIMKEEKFMKEALKQAKKAFDKNEVPIGAVIVLNDKIIARAYNKREHGGDATAHAEILCIKKACKKIGDFRLNGADIYVTLEPCLMCLGACLNARIKNIYYGASVNKDSAIKSEELIERAELNHKCNVIGGIYKDECSNIIKDYFQEQRKKNKGIN